MKSDGVKADDETRRVASLVTDSTKQRDLEIGETFSADAAKGPEATTIHDRPTVAVWIVRLSSARNDGATADMLTTDQPKAADRLIELSLIGCDAWKLLDNVRIADRVNVCVPPNVADDAKPALRRIAEWMMPSVGGNASDSEKFSLAANVGDTENVLEGVPLLWIKKMPTLRFVPIVHGDWLGKGSARGRSDRPGVAMTESCQSSSSGKLSEMFTKSP
jgi:hypothetical protein